MILDDADGAAARAELRAVVDTLFDRVSPRSDVVARAERAAAGEPDTTLWQRLNQDIGAVGLTAPGRWAGSDAGFAEAAVLFEVAGRRVATVPLLGTYLAVEMLVRSGDAVICERVVPRLVSGAAVAAVAWSTPHLRATSDAGSWRISGEVDLVIDGSAADVLVAVVDSADGPVILAVELDGAVRDRREALDLARDLTRLRFADAPAERVVMSDPRALVEQIRDLAAAAVACEQLGVAEQALADAVAYAREREQFGRPIGSFQAIKHLLADQAVAADLARSLVEHAIWACVEAPECVPTAAAMAALAASEAACGITAENVQVHGGIGFSWEHPAHLYFRKARSNAALVGDRFHFTERLLAGIGVEAERDGP